MPNLFHLPQYERHLSLAALAHCPRHYQYVDQLRAGVLSDAPTKESLLLGILVHVGVRALWTQKQAGQDWLPSVAFDAMDGTSELTGALACDGPAMLALAKRAVGAYAAQWTGARDHWKPLLVEPLDVPPLPAMVLEDEFVAYPDLITTALPLYGVLVVDYKTSYYKFEAAKWEWHPELLTQCLAAQQLQPNDAIFYQIDYLQRPSKQSTVWSFPATPVWEFTSRKAAVAREWILNGLGRRNWHRQHYPDQPWPQEISQCQTPWGMCEHYERCFGD